LADAGPPRKDPKTRLQEWLQGHGEPLPHYELLAEHGEEHARRFEVACVIESPRALRFEGSGGSRRAAEQMAAEAALAELVR
jgi:ribonuclease-3